MENNTFLSPEFLSFASAIIRGVSLVTGVLLIAAFIQLIHTANKIDN
jgi:hypothetical protein